MYLVLGGCLILGVSDPRGSASWGGLPLGGIPICTEADPPLRGQTDACKNITLATTSLQPVVDIRNEPGNKK